MPWHPPIPKGALVEARMLGAGLVLLGYCYDIVREGGLIEINLHEMCCVLGTSYASVRRWWSMMQDQGIIERVEERGRKGVRAYFNPDWIDWRYAEMRSETSSPVSTNNAAYKVLMTPDQAESHGGGVGSGMEPLALPPAVALLLDIFDSAEISHEQGDDVCSTVTDLALWREVLVTWRANGYKPRIGNLLDRYRKEIKEHANGQAPRNSGRKQQYTPPSPEWAGWTATDLDKPL